MSPRRAGAACAVLLFFCSSSHPGAASAQAGRKISRSFEVLQKLLEVPGVSGHEEKVRETILGLLPDWARAVARVDSRGNLLVEAGKGGVRVLFIAHMDETGYAITSIERDGTARLKSLGGFFNTLYEAHTVVVHTRGGERRAVIRPRRDYLRPADAPRPPTDEELVLDFGTDRREETLQLGVVPGDWITAEKRFRRLAGRMGSGRSVDDRAGCTALVQAAHRLDPSRLRNRVTLAWSVEEEIGLRGAEALAASSRFDVVFAVDTFVSSDSPLESKGFALGVLGEGPVLRAMDNSNLAPEAQLARVRELAGARGMSLQIGLTHGGNDGSVFPVHGAVDVPLSWPTIYSHSPVELIQEDDLDRLGDLVALLAEGW